MWDGPLGLLACFVIVVGTSVVGRYVSVYRIYFQRLERYIAVARAPRWISHPRQEADSWAFEHEGFEFPTKELNALGFDCAAEMVDVPLFVAPAPSPTPAPLADPHEPKPETVLVAASTKMYSRVFLSSLHKAMATVTLTLCSDAHKRDGEAHYQYVLTSLAKASDEGEAWEYYTNNWGTGDHRLTWISLGRRPRDLKTHLPNASPSELWAYHQRRREEIGEKAGFEWQVISVGEAQENRRANFERVEATWAAMTPLKLARELRRWRKRRNKFEWLGELEGKLPP